MHLRMQDNQIGRKFTGLTPADMDRLPLLIKPKKKFSVVNSLVRQLGLPCLLGKSLFLLIHSPSS
jgi:hypothetical protein